MTRRGSRVFFRGWGELEILSTGKFCRNAYSLNSVKMCLPTGDKAAIFYRTLFVLFYLLVSDHPNTSENPPVLYII